MRNDIALKEKRELLRRVDEEALPFIRMNEKAIAAGREPPFLNPRAEAIRYKLVKRDDGSVAKVKRDTSLLIDVGEVSSAWIYNSRVNRTKGAKMLDTEKKGKYNDEHKIYLTTPCSIEHDEIETMS